MRQPRTWRHGLVVGLVAYGAVAAFYLALSLAIGCTVVALIDCAERHPTRARAVTAVIVAGFVVTVIAVGVLSAPIRPLLPWWSIVVANGFATACAGWYMIRRRPGLVRRLTLAPV
jgi:hypothetical protein